MSDDLLAPGGRSLREHRKARDPVVLAFPRAASPRLRRLRRTRAVRAKAIGSRELALPRSDAPSPCDHDGPCSDDELVLALSGDRVRAVTLAEPFTDSAAESRSGIQEQRFPPALGMEGEKPLERRLPSPNALARASESREIRSTAVVRESSAGETGQPLRPVSTHLDQDAGRVPEPRRQSDDGALRAGVVSQAEERPG